MSGPKPMIEMSETNLETQKTDSLMNYLECELKESRSLEEFKAKFADVKIILELSSQTPNEVTVAAKLN